MPNREDSFLPSLKADGVLAQLRTRRPSGLGSESPGKSPRDFANEQHTTSPDQCQGRRAPCSHEDRHVLSCTKSQNVRNVPRE